MAPTEGAAEIMTSAQRGTQLAGFEHLGLFYATAEDYISGVVPFIQAGRAAGEPVLVAVPGDKIDLLREHVGSGRGPFGYVDMTVLGANPMRIIPAIRRFTGSHRGRRTRFVGEPIWPGRSLAETTEASRHEALLNAACAGVATTILCPYDTAGLDAAVLATARQTHPQIAENGTARRSADYSGVSVAVAIAQVRPACPADAAVMAFSASDLPRLRHWVREQAANAGLSTGRIQDLVIAVNELASNTIEHTRGSGEVRVWRDSGALVCEVLDEGRITDPLAGRHVPPPPGAGGHGLPIVSEVCDLVELRSGGWGTSITLHIRTTNRAGRLG